MPLLHRLHTMRRRRAPYSCYAPPMTGRRFLRRCLVVLFCVIFVGLAWAAMSWYLGNCTSALVVALALPVVLAILGRLGRSGRP